MALPLMVLATAMLLGCGGKHEKPAFPPVDSTFDPAVEASTNPYAVNPDPNSPGGLSRLVAVRVGYHPEAGGWDRIVFEFRDFMSEAEIEYTRDPVLYCPSGERVQLPSAAVLTVRFSAQWLTMTPAS